MKTNKGMWILALGAAVLFGFAGVTMAKKEGKSGPINDVCPMSGKGAKESKTSTYEVKFCCGKCLGKFQKDPAGNWAKVASAEAGKCAFSGKAVDDAKTAKVTIGFCCGNCKGKFDADPAKHVSKVKAKG